MSKSLEMDVVAEGVENEEQRDFLLASGCQLFQGFLFAKPMTIEDFDRIVSLSDKDSK